jgi:F0F1-type ATP synthase assembly protein I
MLQYTGVGLEMGLSVILGIIGGRYLDRQFGTGPILFWCGFFLGLGAAAKALVDIAAKAKKDMSDDAPVQPKKD